MDEFSRIDNVNQPRRINTSQHYAKASLPFQQKSATRIRNASRQHESGIKGAPVVTTSYYNYTDREIVVTSRNGTAVVVEPLGNYAADEFIVCVTHTMRRGAMERALDTLRSRANVDERETHYWIRAYEAALHNHTHDSLSASVEYVVYFRDICDAGGRCYMPDLDLLVEWLADHGSIHPFDKIKRDEAMVTNLAPGIGEATCVFMIKAVDNAHQVQRANRYINLGGDIFMVPVERDLKYSTGIHVVSRTPLQKGEAVSDVIHRSFTFEEADEKFGLHRSIEDAINGGPLHDMAKILIERETTERRVGEARMRTGQLEQEEELQRLRNEAALLKTQQEREAAARRNYVEWAKTAVAVLGAIVTVYGILSKLKSS
jgi:hypothetical protein